MATETAQKTVVAVYPVNVPTINNGGFVRYDGDVYAVTEYDGNPVLSLATCEGCNGTQEPLNDDSMCGSCVRLDAEVDSDGT